MANDKAGTLDTPARPARWHRVRTELLAAALYTTGFALGQLGVLLTRLLFSPVAH